ncbi:MAG: FliI/YscN family ATPase [Polyangiales bacterium]
MALDLDALKGRLDAVSAVRTEGHVTSVVGLSIRATVPSVRLGDAVRIHRRGRGPLLAEVVGFDEDLAVLLPLEDPAGLGPDDRVESLGAAPSIRCSPAMVGRVLDGLGRPLDGGPELVGEPVPLVRKPPHPLARRRIDTPLPLGVRALDAFCTLGVGQRIGLFAGSGVGKSTLLGQIARQAKADVIVVALVGERGREVREFLEDSLGDEGRARSVVVCATSDEPALVRLKSVHTATAIAEFFRDRGQSVLLLVDSVTRFARAGREVGLSSGEAPARRGYPPSVFAALPALLERAGSSDRGAITAIYTVLVEGSDLEEPIADEVRGILDGHVILDRSLGARGRWPAIDVVGSLSRVMPAVTTDAHRKAAATLRETMALLESKRDLVMLGAYQRGSDARLDRALSKSDAIEAFLRQAPHEHVELGESVAALERLA